jgi:hypothetical protein
MIWFSYTYIDSRLVLMDLTETRRAGLRMFIASLSEDPRVHFLAERPEDALNTLVAYLRAGARHPDVRITFWQDPQDFPHAKGANHAEHPGAVPGDRRPARA